MAKLTALVLLFLTALAAVASCSAYTTVVMTTVTDESCEREMEQKMPMRHCMMYMQSRMRGPYKEDFLRSAVDSRRYEGEHLQECCGELSQFSSGCRCDAVKEMMTEMPQLEMKRMACSLPTMCGMSACACPRVFA